VNNFKCIEHGTDLNSAGNCYTCLDEALSKPGVIDVTGGCKHGTIKGLCSFCDRKPDTVTISREPMKEVPNYVALAETVKVPSKLKGRFESELFWTGVYAMRDALISDELTKALEVQGE